MITADRTPFYHLVPKDFYDNVEFRKELISYGCESWENALELWIMCSRDLLFYCNAFCVAAGTRVVTDRGLVPIESVTHSDKVWDGDNWVSQEGALCRGRKSVIFSYGIHLTPDHKVWTNHGWQEAVHRHDRAAVRLPDGYSARGFLSQHDSGRMALSMRMRDGDRQGREQSSQGVYDKLRMCSPSNQVSGKARSKQRFDLHNLDVDADAVLKSERYLLRALRRAWDSCLFALAEIREFLERYGREAIRSYNRTHRQQWQLRAWELSLGFAQGASQQHTQKSEDSHITRHSVPRRNRQNGGNFSQRSTEAHSTGKDWRLPPSEASSGQALVYDLINCGPKQAFTVVDACGEPTLVHNCCTYDPRKDPSQLPFITWPFQDESLLELDAAIESGHDVLIEKSRDMGASWLSVLVCEWRWHFRDMQSFLMVSRKDEFVDKTGDPKALMWKIDFIHKHLPQFLMPTGGTNRINKHLHQEDNGSTIDGESTTGDVARGDRRTAIFLDEFAAVEEGNAVLAATADATRCRIFNSTPQGTQNAFYKVRQSTIKKIRLHWPRHPEKSRGLYQSEPNGNVKRLDAGYEYAVDYPFILDGKLRSPWYDAECKRRNHAVEIAQELDINYAGSVYQFFDPALTDRYEREFCRQAFWQGDYDQHAEKLVPNQDGPLRLWLNLDVKGQPPLDRRYAIGCDISAGSGASNSVASIMDCKVREKIGEFAHCRLDPTAFASVVVGLCKIFGDAFLIWETNGPGRIFGNRVTALGYRNIYWRTNEQSLSRKPTDIPGWTPTCENKMALLGEYRRQLFEGDFINRSHEAIDELRQYITHPSNGYPVHSAANDTEDPTGAKHNHGDRVIADALLTRAIVDVAKEEPVVAQKIPYGSLAWLREYDRQQRELQVA